MKNILTIDFGSTNTKVTAVNIEKEEIIASAVSYTTIEDDIRIGLENAKKDIFSQCGIKNFDNQIACSSAAGGLKMISCGLVPDLTVKASKMAATSAGAKVLKSFSYELTPFDKEEICELKPDIILLCGGIDGGNKNVIIHNAKVLAELNLEFYTIVAGNRSASYEVSQILNSRGKYHKICENVLPDFNNLNILPVKYSIRDLFIERIIYAKGLDEAQKIMDNKIVPTPFSVFEASEMLSIGIKENEGLGDILLFDVGGATTDVYSMCSGTSKEQRILKGIKEPYAKRTVEGDIGVRYSLPFLLDEINYETALLPKHTEIEDINNWADKCKNYSIIPKTEKEKSCDMFLARNAIEISTNRHVGAIEEVYTATGKMFVQTGKDLSDIKYIIGTGGSVINSIDKNYVLSASLSTNYDKDLLKPEKSKFLIDEKNILASMGLISKINPMLSLNMMKKYIVSL